MSERRLLPVPFAEAIEWAKARGVVLPDAYYDDLQGLARALAFTIAGLAKLDQLQAVLDSLAEATANGETMAAWRERVTDPAGAAALSLPWHRLDNIFRTNIQGHYSRGRSEQQARTTATHPWYLYDAVDDSRTRPSHAAMDGMVARYDDPIWKVWTPPNGYQCRCRRIALSERQAVRYREADARRLKDPRLAEARATAQPDPGWDYDIGADPMEGVKRALDKRRGKTNDKLFSEFQSEQQNRL